MGLIDIHSVILQPQLHPLYNQLKRFDPTRMKKCPKLARTYFYYGEYSILTGGVVFVSQAPGGVGGVCLEEPARLGVLGGSLCLERNIADQCAVRFAG